MKITRITQVTFKLLSFILLPLSFTVSALAQGTAFTYQGRLNSGTNPANGTYDLRFILYNSDIGGSQQGPLLTNSATPVNNGLFTVTLDFTNVFDGTPRWLEIDVRTNGSGAFTQLAPRQPLTPSPYAIFAGSVAAGGIASGTYANPVTFNNSGDSFSGTFTGNGGGLTNLNAATLGGLSPSNFWKLAGNAGTTAGVNFLGTTDNQPLELKANGQRALRLEPVFTNTLSGPGVTVIYSNAPNVVGGSAANLVDSGVMGAVIGGGGLGGYFYNTGTVWYAYGAVSNRVSANFATVGGGYGNFILTNSDLSTIGGGVGNTIQQAFEATISGGSANTIQTNSGLSTIAGGSGNTILTNVANGFIGGGIDNIIRGTASYSTIGGGDDNRVYEGATYSAIGGGGNNISFSLYGTIAGGQFNQVGGTHGAIGGGTGNAISGPGESATIAGGSNNHADAAFSAIGGGTNNFITGASSGCTIVGGYNNLIQGGIGSVAAGQNCTIHHTGSFMWSDGISPFTTSQDNQFLIRAGGGVGIGSNETPPGGLRVHTGGLAVTGASSPNYGSAQGVFLESIATNGYIFAFDYAAFQPRPLILNSPGGNVGIGTITPAYTLDVAGTIHASGAVCAANVSCSSDRNAKERFEPVNALEILDKVTSLPISRWNFKQDIATRHLGPMAQDFYAAFNVGADDKHIGMVDEGGVALAAIQGLNEKVELGSQKAAAKIQTLEAENAELKQSVAELKELVSRLAATIDKN